MRARLYVIRGRLTAEVGAVVWQALTAATDRLYAESRLKVPGPYVPTANQHQADALGIIAEAALRHDLDPGTSGARCQVVVHVDAAVLADPDQPGQSVLDGVHCSAEHSRRIACDASRVILTHDAEGRVLEVGAPRRCAGRSSIGTAAVASLAAARASRRVTTSNTGRTAAPPRCRTWRRCAGATIARFMKKDFSSSACPMASCSSRLGDR